MRTACATLATGLALALVVGGVPAYALADETPATETAGAGETPVINPQPDPSPEPEPEPEPTPKPEPKPKPKPEQEKPATRATLAKNLGKTAKSSKAYKVAGTKYKVSKAKAGKKLVKLVKKLRRSYRVEFAMVDLKTGATLASQSGKKIYSASCLKGPYVAAINKYKRAGTGSGTKRLERQTIVYSNNDTYQTLHDRYGTDVMHKYAQYAQVSASYPWQSCYDFVKPADLAKLWVANYWYFFKDTNGRSKYIRNLYTHGTESFIYQAHKGKKRVYAKPGWYPRSHGNVHNDAGIVTSKIKVGGKKKGYPYVICVMSGAYGSEGQLRSIVRQLDKVHTEMVKNTLTR